MKITINRTQNGAWVHTVDSSELPGDGEIYKDKSYVFDAYKHDGDDMSGLLEMLYDVLDDMGWTGDRHDQQRIKVSIVHGDKFVHAEDAGERMDCRICKGEL